MQDRIPIFFSSCGKENGHSWSKEKTLRDDLTGKAVNSPQTGTGRHELPKKSGSRLPAALYPNIKSAYPRTCGCRANQIGAFLLPCVPLRYALPGPFPVLSSSLALRPLGGWFFLPRPSSPGGVSKGEGPQSRPFVPRGAWGTGGVPHVSGGGLRGDLCAKGPSPCPIMEMSCGSRELVKAASPRAFLLSKS